MRPPLLPLLGAIVVTSSLSCASGGETPAAGSAASATPAGPVDLAGTKWKLLAQAGLDGRTIVFKKEGKTYGGYLEDFGIQLRNVMGVRKGMKFFTLEPTSNPGEYTGFYESPGSDGTLSSREVNVSVSGDTLSWNLNSATWVRVTE